MSDFNYNLNTYDTLHNNEKNISKEYSKLLSIFINKIFINNIYKKTSLYIFCFKCSNHKSPELLRDYYEYY